jgi:hypothetical protein
VTGPVIARLHRVITGFFFGARLPGRCFTFDRIVDPQLRAIVFSVPAFASRARAAVASAFLSDTLRMNVYRDGLRRNVSRHERSCSVDNCRIKSVLVRINGNGTAANILEFTTTAHFSLHRFARIQPLPLQYSS